MRKASHTRDVLQSGGFWLHYHIGRILKVGVVGQSLVITSICVVAMLIASGADHSFFLEGRDVGLLEHPAIWAFLVLQTVLPISIARSWVRVQKAILQKGEVADHGGKESDLVAPSVQEFLGLKDTESRIAAALIYSIGIAAWVWNTYQNQLPGIAVPYDFWDSTTYLWGFAVTRVYKLYLFVVLLPYLALIHVAILVAILRLVRRTRVSGELRLLPFHPDGVGGLGFIANLISKPIILTLVIGAVTTGAAFIIHRAANVTPLIGLLILLGWAAVAYVAPILFLRVDIAAMKREMIQRLRLQQQENYSNAMLAKNLDFRTVRKENEALEYFDKVCGKVRSISSYPHLKRLIGVIGLALSPSLVAFAVKSLLGVIPVFIRILARP
jgi:hypothetical protein